MPIPFYLAMTAGEYAACGQFPAPMGWLACHFSSSGNGLSNIPDTLAQNALLIVDDSIPFQNHDVRCICSQLQEAVARLHTAAVILDFQRPGNSGIAKLVSVLQQELSCSVIVTPQYAQDGQPVFLPPAPMYQPLAEYLRPWQGREIWLDVTPLATEITITDTQSTAENISMENIPEQCYTDPLLHCKYTIQIRNTCAVFTLYRDADNWETWLSEAKSLGVQGVIGLFQEWRQQKPPVLRQAVL